MSNVVPLSSTSTEALPIRWIEKLFDQMLLDFGKKFVDMWAGADPDRLIAHWSREMSGFTGEEISRGLEAQKKRDWPPTLPEFRKMCRPDTDPMVAYYEAVSGVQARAKGEMGTWSHPAIFWAAMPMAFDLGLQSFSHIRGRWERALAEQMSKGEWAAIPQPMVALPAPGQAMLSREKATQMIEELGATVVVKASTHKIDGKRWARNIMARIERKNHGVPDWIVKDAKKALQMST
jgi:hypothetical protein